MVDADRRGVGFHFHSTVQVVCQDDGARCRVVVPPSYHSVAPPGIITRPLNTVSLASATITSPSPARADHAS